MRQVGAEGIVSKRRGSLYGGGESREWLKTKVFELGTFMITGFAELGDRRLDAIYVAEERDGQLVPAGAVKFGLAGRGLWRILDQLRVGVARKSFVPVRPVLQAQVKFFGRYQRHFKLTDPIACAGDQGSQMMSLDRQPSARAFIAGFSEPGELLKPVHGRARPLLRPRIQGEDVFLLRGSFYRAGALRPHKLDHNGWFHTQFDQTPL